MSGQLSKEKLRHEFIFIHELCRPFPDDRILSVLRANHWDVNRSVNIVLQQIAAQMNCFEATSDQQLMFQVHLDAITSFFIDFTVYLLPQKSVPLGISLDKRLQSYTVDDDESKSKQASGSASDDRGIVYIKHILPNSLALVAGLKSLDQILRISGELVSLTNSAMDTDDLYDKISVMKFAEEVVALSCRRVMQPAHYCALPFATQQYYLIPTLPVPDMSVSVALKNRENSMESDSFCQFLHPIVLFLQTEQLITERRRAVLLHRHVIGMKEGALREFEWGYLRCLEVLLQKTTQRQRRERENSQSFTEDATALSLSQSVSQSQPPSQSQSHTCSSVAGTGGIEEPIVFRLSLPATTDPHQLRKFSTQALNKSKSIKSINRHIDTAEIISLNTTNNEIVRVLSSFLRPALTVRIVRAEKFIPAGASPISSVSDVMYVISVYDVKTASAWSIKRSFQQFYDLRQSLLQVRESLSFLSFPMKRIFKVMEQMVMSTRQLTLDAFLRAVVRISTTMNPTYLSSIKLRILIERFLDVHIRYEDLSQFYTDSLLSKYDNSEYLVLTTPPQAGGGAAGAAPTRTPTPDTSKNDVNVCDTEVSGVPAADADTSNSSNDNSKPSQQQSPVPAVKFCHSQLQFIIERSLSVFIQHILCQEDFQSLILMYTSTWWELPEEMLVALDGKVAVPGLGQTARSPELRSQQQACDEMMDRQLISLRTFMDNLQCVVYNTVVGDCFDIITSYGAYHSAEVPGVPVVPHMSSVDSVHAAGESEESDTGTGTGGSTNGYCRTGAAASAVKYSALWEPQPPITARRQKSVTSPGRGGGGSSDSVVAANLNTLINHMICDRYYGSSVTFNPLLAQFRRKVSLKLPVLTATVAVSASPGEGSESSKTVSTPPSAELEYTELEILVQNAIRRLLEMELCAPHIYTHIRKFLQRRFAGQEDSFNSKIAKLRDKSQSYFGIPPHLVSPSDWYDVKKSFRMIRKGLLPQDRIAAFLETVKMITIVCHLEHSAQGATSSGGGGGDGGGGGVIPGTSEHSLSSGECRATATIIGADDLLPIMVYILVNAKCVNILALNEEFKELCPYYLKLTETGYYLTTLDAALTHLVQSELENCGAGGGELRGRTVSAACDVSEGLTASTAYDVSE